MRALVDGAWFGGYPSLHDALANNNVHDSNPPPEPHTQKPMSTLETAGQTPQHETIAPGHTARAKADNTADHTADNADHTADTQTTQQACP